MLHIRRATRDDIPVLCDLSGAIQEGHREAHPDYFKPHEVTPMMIAEYEAQLVDANTYVYIGEVDGTVVGHIIAQIIDRPENSYMYAVRYLYVAEMGVFKAYRSAGYGEQLMQHVFELAKSLGMSRVILNVWAFNERAIAFYKRQGFAFRDMRMEVVLE
jgi:ribosomal protein S18 acetylase RimI-like enzyme